MRNACSLGVLAVCFVGIAAAAAAQQHPTSDTVSESNNPLSDLEGINFNEYYAGSLYDLDRVVNTLNMQIVVIPRRPRFGLYHMVRATMPVLTAPATLTSYASGFGDFTFQDAFKFSKIGARTEWGVGPLVVMPTATSEELGAGKWQAGVAVIMIRLLGGGSIIGGLVTWQTDFAGDSDRPGTNLATFQPEVALAIGTTGFYISSSPIGVLDFENDRYLIPFSLGFGKVFMVDKTIVNVTTEPQFTVYHKGELQPTLQLFFGLTLQWKRTPKQARSALAGPSRPMLTSLAPRLRW